MSFSNRVDIFNQALPVSGVLLIGKVQLGLVQAAAPLAFKLYGKADTTFSNAIVSGTGTADANGDADISLDFGSNIGTPGTYILQVTRTSGSPALTAVNSSDIYIGAIGTYIDQLKHVLCAFEKIERFEEPGMPNAALDTYRFGYANWIAQTPLLIEEDDYDKTPGATFKIDYTNGQVQYITALLSGHDVRASYQFNLFTYADYLSFFQRSLSQINGYKPQSNYSFDSAPSQWLDLIVLGAYIRALETISLKLPTFKYKRLFDDPAAMMGQINMLLASAKAEFTVLLAKIKRRGITQPLAVSSMGGGGLAYQADGVNWRSFVVGG